MNFWLLAELTEAMWIGILAIIGILDVMIALWLWSKVLMRKWPYLRCNGKSAHEIITEIITCTNGGTSTATIEQRSAINAHCMRLLMMTHTPTGPLGTCQHLLNAKNHACGATPDYDLAITELEQLT